MKIAVVGSRGIPNYYGGFEQFAEYLSLGLVKKGHDVTVYNPHFHPYQKSEFKKVTIVHKWCPENLIGAAAHFIYDYLSLRDALQKKFDVILMLGYATSVIAYLCLPINNSVIITNMDGLEWKRDKWSPAVKKLTKWFEKVGVKKSHFLVSDNKGIQDHIDETYNQASTMIPYGAEVCAIPEDNTLINEYQLESFDYYVLVARLEPENNIELILDGYVQSKSNVKFIVIGNHKTAYGKTLQEKYVGTNVEFLGGVYDMNVLNHIRYFSRVYFHGHSVGGTNPSLLEAMASHSYIAAHDNPFNRSVLEEGAFYFKTSLDVEKIINSYQDLAKNRDRKVALNLNKIRSDYSWDTIIGQYEDLFIKAIR
ncbi:glycosyl transferase [bacterium]|nr:glycosyl transferase [bacterium]